MEIDLDEGWTLPYFELRGTSKSIQEMCLLFATGKVPSSFLTLFTVDKLDTNKIYDMADHFKPASENDPVRFQQYKLFSSLLAISGGNIQEFARNGEELCAALQVKGSISCSPVQKVQRLLYLVHGGIIRPEAEIDDGWYETGYEEVFRLIFGKRQWRCAQILHRFTVFSSETIARMFNPECEDKRLTLSASIIENELFQKNKSISSDKPSLGLKSSEINLVTNLLRFTSNDYEGITGVLQTIGVPVVEIEYIKDICSGDVARQITLISHLPMEISTHMKKFLVYLIQDPEGNFEKLVHKKIEHDIRRSTWEHVTDNKDSH